MQKLLVANRSEIAIRVFRAATELGLGTVAVYTYEDRFSLHRFKADESYLIGPAEGGEPVKGYLNIDDIIAVAKEHGVRRDPSGLRVSVGECGLCARRARRTASRSSARRRNCWKRSATRPPPSALPIKANVPTLPGTEHGLKSIRRGEEGREGDRLSDHHQSQLRRRRARDARSCKNADELPANSKKPSAKPARRSAGRKSSSRRYIGRAKHIEVQILGDQHGNLVHLWERDCSVQRRHQKVVEVAPSINLPLDLRERDLRRGRASCAKQRIITTPARSNFCSMSTRGEFYFIEVNPRIQVEHTVTEVVTGIDIVKSQILVAQGHKLHEAPLNISAAGEDRDAAA